MEKIKKLFHDWAMLEIVWLFFVSSVIIFSWYMNGDTLFMLTMSLTGSVGLVLGAKGKILGLVFSLINALLYAIYCFDLQLYGEVMYNAFYSVPTSAVGIYLWNKHKNNAGNVEFKTLSLNMTLCMLGGTVIATFLYAEFLAMLGGRLAFMDSLTTVVSVIASLLFILRYADQWLMWVIVNVLSIWMWCMVYMSGETISTIVIVMKCINLCNALYGYMNWKKLSKTVESVESVELVESVVEDSQDV